MLSQREREIAEILLQERNRRKAPHWARTFADRPREFIGELIGKEEWESDDWLGWRAFVSAAFCEPFQSEAELEIFRQCTKLEYPPTTPPSQIWIPTGRRGGKSRMLAALSVYLACCKDWTPYLDPGELGVIPVLAADRRQARTTMGYVRAFLNHPKLVDRMRSEQIESIALSDNILIEVVTASFRTVRSRTVVSALCDEIAFWPVADESANPDKEIIAALEPAMATIPNALLLTASSPYARKGVLWEVYERWYGRPGGPLVWQASTRQMNPSVPQSFIDDQYEQDPLSAAAEYGAEFRSDVDSFVTREALDAVIERGVFEIPARDATTRVQYRAFVDPSGGSSDSMTLAIGHRDLKTGKAVLDVLRERRPPFSPAAVVNEFVKTLLEYRVTRVTGDYYGGQWPGEEFKKHGIAYITSEKRKSDIYLEFLAALNTQRCQLLDDSRMYNQFLSLERRTGRSGMEIVDHGIGGHDDVANVCAGVIVDLVQKAPMRVDHRVLEMSARLFRPQYPLLDDIRPSNTWGNRHW